MHFRPDLTAKEAYIQRKIRYVKTGLLLAWISSITAVSQGILNSIATGYIKSDVESSVVVTILIAITLLAVNDILAGVLLFYRNSVAGRGLKEYKRVAGLKVSWMILLAALAAGPFATGCWMASISFCGITYATATMSLTPIVTAILSRMIFKERLNLRIYIGIVIAITGVLLANWAPPEGISNFYLGIILAALAPIGFAAEGILSTYAADIIDPSVGCGLYRCFGSGISCLLLVSISSLALGKFNLIGQTCLLILTRPATLICVLFMALMAAISYESTYLAFNKSGPTRTLAVVNTMPVWSIPLGLAFTAAGLYQYTVTPLAIGGAFIVVAGIVLVIAKPSELFSLRDV